MEKGYKVITRTITEFLNETFGTTHKGWMRSTHPYNNKTVIWMIRIDQEERAGFKNYFVDGNIVEESMDKPTRSDKPFRMVFQIIENRKEKTKTFIYLGKYKLDLDKSSPTRRVFVPVD